jgi:hypothetical protein
MGQSTDAYLFWGFSGEGEEEGESWIAEEFERDWESAYAAKRGLVEPTSSDFDSPEWKAYWRQQRELIAACPCEIGSHCSSSYPIEFACITASFATARRGDPQEITSIEVGPGWRDELMAFCELMGIPWQEPKWWLASNWG